MEIMFSTAIPPEAVTLSQATSAAESDGYENTDAIELEERRVVQQFILQEKTLLEKKHLFQQPSGTDQETDIRRGCVVKPDLGSMTGSYRVKTTAPDGEDLNKLSERGTESLTDSLTDELSRPISEVDDDREIDQNEVSSEFCIYGLPPSCRQNVRKDFTKEGGQDRIHGSLEVDDFEGPDGEIDLLGAGKPHNPRSEQFSGGTLCPDRTPAERNEERENQDGEVFQASPELPDEQPSTEMKLCSLSEEHIAPQSDPEEFNKNRSNLEQKKTDSTDTEVDDAASNLGALSTKPQIYDEECARITRLDSDITLFYPQQLDPEDIINPFSLEVRIRKAREHQNISLEWGPETNAENQDGISQPQVNFEDTSSILTFLTETFAGEPTGTSVRALENGFHSRVNERTGSVPGDVVDDAKELSENKPGVGEAVLLGALASGVNRPTWFVIRAVLVAMVASLFLLLHVAIKSGSSFILLNVLFLISIAGGLILLLGWYISQIGLVSVDKQLAELSLTSEPRKLESKTL